MQQKHKNSIDISNKTTYNSNKNTQKGGVCMAETLISKEVEERRLNDFLEIAEHWDEIPEYARGKLDGTISAITARGSTPM